MLENYYDLARKDRFQELFGHLLIGKNPTPSHNQYFILKWDFSCVDPSGSAKDIKRAFHDHINSCIKAFMSDYEEYLIHKIEVDPEKLSSYSNIGTCYFNFGVEKNQNARLINDNNIYKQEIAKSVDARKNAVLWLEIAYKKSPDNQVIKDQLLQLYRSLHMTDKIPGWPARHQ